MQSGAQHRAQRTVLTKVALSCPRMAMAVVGKRQLEAPTTTA